CARRGIVEYAMDYW
nr:immunoglobulin heavy chain junction region [Mus musculus]